MYKNHSLGTYLQFKKKKKKTQKWFKFVVFSHLHSMLYNKGVPSPLLSSSLITTFHPDLFVVVFCFFCPFISVYIFFLLGGALVDQLDLFFLVRCRGVGTRASSVSRHDFLMFIKKRRPLVIVLLSFPIC